jgi:hypothetical protein
MTYLARNTVNSEPEKWVGFVGKIKYYYPDGTIII